MKKTKVVFTGSIIFNILFVAFFSLVVFEKGGIPYILGKISTVTGLASENEPNVYSIEYLNNQSLYSELPIEEGSTIFLGDSIIHSGKWAELLGSTKYVNRGIPGDTSTGVIDRLEEIVEANPSQIFIMVGINDLASGNQAKLLDNYKDIINLIKNESPETDIYIHSILPINSDEYEKNSSTKISNKTIREANVSLEKIANENGVEFVNLFSIMSNGDKELKADLTFDGIHLSGEAYLLWKNEIKKYLN
jgi:lysophospholipase L1-like esterase